MSVLIIYHQVKPVDCLSRSYDSGLPDDSELQQVYAACSRSEEIKLHGHTIRVVRLKKDGSEDRLAFDICMHLCKNLYPWVPFVACITSESASFPSLS